ncbi:IPP transferase-domain-containing protein [Sphaerosporella brunnea]|uniref:tRNA dimethylallyltransferase n=1 Tax=Sphaerosporella brunnea TaxID=1250544 RepID=A0A5J5ELB7_9PEZI|nr:IPP transferase-domain-containing protein [Sphaerosporella brunnea]
MSGPPLISVIGATGTGKSQLAVELALSLNGEVINADAMQLYRGLPIITNKITSEERKGVPHHLLGCLDPSDVWQVGKFIKEAEKTIEDIRRRGHLPILVGGTHYYVQSLLFPHGNEEKKEDADNEYAFPPVDINLAEKYPVLDAPTPKLYSALKAVDPIIAARWHPNDRRKIRRSLEIYYSTGCKQTASEVYAAQRAAKQQSVSPDIPKYRNLIFWVHSETDVLRARLDSRVGKMITAGMWEEIEEMERLYYSFGDEADLNQGIWQSIGFKEFLPYLKMRKTGAGEKELEEARTAAVENMKTATRQYARSQVKWVRIKFLNALRAANESGNHSSIFLMDSTDVPKYDENVTLPAIDIAQDFLEYKLLPNPLTLSELAKTCLTPQRDFDISQRPDLWAQRTCEVCDVITTNEPEWERHLKSSKHKKKVAGTKKKEEIEKFLRKRGEAEASQKETEA